MTLPGRKKEKKKKSPAASECYRSGQKNCPAFERKSRDVEVPRVFATRPYMRIIYIYISIF